MSETSPRIFISDCEGPISKNDNAFELAAHFVPKGDRFFELVSKYDDILADALAKHLRLKAAWQERVLRELSPNTIIFVDEPYMNSFGSAFVSLSRPQVITLLEEVFKGISGLKGIHCCGNTDWSVLLETSVDILSLDAYNYGYSLSLYPVEVKAFVERGGIIAWGIVPNDEDVLAKETADSLVHRLEETVGALAKKGIDADLLMDRCLVTPSCTLSPLSPQAATNALELTAEVARRLREKYGRETQATEGETI